MIPRPFTTLLSPAACPSSPLLVPALSLQPAPVACPAVAACTLLLQHAPVDRFRHLLLLAAPATCHVARSRYPPTLPAPLYRFAITIAREFT